MSACPSPREERRYPFGNLCSSGSKPFEVCSEVGECTNIMECFIFETSYDPLTN